MLTKRATTAAFMMTLTAAVVGCGGSDETATGATSVTQPATATPEPPPVAAINSATVDTPDDLADESKVDEKNSPTWALSEIMRLRSAPTPTDPAAVTAHRRKLNAQVIDLATKAIAETHEKAELQDQFTQAVRQLLQARLEMALRGQPDDIDALYDDVRNLTERDPKSPAAEEGAYTLARYAHTNARRFATQEPRWLEEFARQARLYADAWHNRPDRAAPLVFAAARSCELYAKQAAEPVKRAAMMNEAKLCYTTLKNRFPDLPQGQQAVAVLRRLALEGTELSQFSGPTLNGKYARIEQLRGRPAIIVFWSSDNPEFAQALPALKTTLEQYAPQRLYLVGVNLDRDHDAATDFIKTHQVPGSHIFFPEEDQQRWDNPLVRYWGVLDIPTVWIVDPNGVVVNTTARLEELATILPGLLDTTDPPPR